MARELAYLQNYGVSTRLVISPLEYGMQMVHPESSQFDSDPFEVRVLRPMRLRDELARPVTLAKHSSISSNVTGGPYSPS